MRDHVLPILAISVWQPSPFAFLASPCAAATAFRISAKSFPRIRSIWPNWDWLQEYDARRRKRLGFKTIKEFTISFIARAGRNTADYEHSFSFDRESFPAGSRAPPSHLLCSQKSGGATSHFLSRLRAKPKGASAQGRIGKILCVRRSDLAAARQMAL